MDYVLIADGFCYGFFAFHYPFDKPCVQIGTKCFDSWHCFSNRTIYNACKKWISMFFKHATSDCISYSCVFTVYCLNSPTIQTTSSPATIHYCSAHGSLISPIATAIHRYGSVHGYGFKIIYILVHAF